MGFMSDRVNVYHTKKTTFHISYNFADKRRGISDLCNIPEKIEFKLARVSY